MGMDLQGDVSQESTTAPSIALVSGESRQFKHLSRVLRRVVGDVVEADSLSQISAARGLNLVTVSYDELGKEEKQHLMESFAGQKGSPTLVLLSAGSAQRDFPQLFGSKILTNLLVFNNSDVDVVDLLVTIQKILLRDIFGLEKYFTWGIRPFSYTLRSSEDRHAVLDALNQYGLSIGIPRRLCSMIHSAADEFITNAIYNAPVDAHGNSRYTHVPRTEVVTLAPGEEVELRFCCDGRRFGIAAIDSFGSLTPERLSNYLARCFRRGDDQMDMDQGGAGLGFYHIFDALSHFVVNIRPGRRTEMIGLIDVSGSYKDFIMSGKSFNIFVSE